MPKISTISNLPLYKSKTTDCGVVTQNTWYEILSGENIILYLAGAKVAVSDETLELRVTIDGLTIASAAGVACAAAGNAFTGLSTGYYTSNGTLQANLQAAATYISVPTTGFHWAKGRSVKVEVRKTTNAGAATITGYVIYGQY